MSRVEQAVETFAKDFSCAQSVFTAFAADSDLDRETALRVAAGLGGGFGRAGETCGAVTGAILALGLRHCARPATEPTAKYQSYPAVREFLERFRGRHGSLLCRELLGCDISTPEGLKRAQDQGIVKARCPGFVRSAAEIVESLM